MQDQGKRLLLAVGAALAFMLVWNMFWGPKKDDQKADDAKGSAGSAVVAATTNAPVAPKSPVGRTIEPAPAAGTSISAEAPRGPEQTVALKFPKFTATFSSYGGTLVSWKLSDPRFERDATKGELLPQREANAGAFLVNFANSTYVVPEH